MLGDMLHQEEEFLDGFTAEKFMVAVEFNEKKKRKKEYPSKDTFFHFCNERFFFLFVNNYVV